MAWKLKVKFSDGESEIVDEDFETKEDAEAEYEVWLASWRVGNETLKLAGEDYCDADITGCKIWKE